MDENGKKLSSDSLIIFENEDIIIKYDSNGVKDIIGLDSFIFFNNKSEKEILITQFECEQYYKGIEITKSISSFDDLSLPIKLPGKSKGVHNSSVIIEFFINTEDKEFKLGDIINIKIKILLYINGEKYEITKNLVKKLQIIRGIYLP